ncbi:NUMOD4 motif-containing HNH endonuclease [Streptomyces sp. NPDC050564]|uniref:NUMOD4 motif-containing HNH endonuclease n=1 Tax=Streptomyces sp. NPDC050564 TaxID=3365631 RepID=UPI0037A191C1
MGRNAHTTEQWLPVVGFEGKYEVSDLGRVWALKREVALTGSADKDGYRVVSLVDLSGARKARKVHTLVLEAFIGPRPPGHVSRHLDGDPANNELPNLAWGTQAQNVADAIRHGTHAGLAKVSCPRGHPYDEVNTYKRPDGGRDCRTCHRDRAKEAHRDAKRR